LCRTHSRISQCFLLGRIIYIRYGGSYGTTEQGCARVSLKSSKTNMRGREQGSLEKRNSCARELSCTRCLTSTSRAVIRARAYLLSGERDPPSGALPSLERDRAAGNREVGPLARIFTHAPTSRACREQWSTSGAVALPSGGEPRARWAASSSPSAKAPLRPSVSDDNHGANPDRALWDRLQRRAASHVIKIYLVH
jgi:hypothetical protein